MIDKLTLQAELEAWASLYGCQLIDYQNILDAQTLRTLSKYVPIGVIYPVDTSTTKNNLSLPLHTFEYESDGETIVTTYQPKSISKIYTMADETNSSDPSIIQIVPYADRTIYAQLDKTFMWRFTHDSKLMLVPDVPSDVTELYIEFQYDWTNILQLPDAFTTCIISAGKLTLLEILYNRAMFTDVVSNKFNGREDAHDMIDGLDAQLKRAKDDFIREANLLNNTFNSFNECGA